MGEILANVAVLTGLLVAFGWRRSDVQARELGLPSSALGMTVTDYLLRSIGPVFQLLAVVVLGWLAFLLLDPLLQTARRGRAWRVSTWVLAFAWLLLPALVVVSGYVWPASSFALFPLSIGAGLLLTLYALKLRARTRRWNWPRLRLAGLAVTVLSLFWGAMNAAELEGLELADRFAADVRTAQAVAIYSGERLHLTAPGVTEQQLPDGKYRFKYTGLRFVENSGGKFFFASDGWTRTSGVVLVLRDEAHLRFEFIRGG
ncbi:hypothetical protein [Actinokineospora alba]|uniref:hypothetical protein n=1 Tax=Actinokineospora alba TaxID=504798 RepID=UPI00105D1A17|nr:hypothetical protein [Actinokineospora alba]